MGQPAMIDRIRTSVDRYLFAERNLLVIGILRMALVYQLMRYVFLNHEVEFSNSLINQLHQRSFLIDFLSKTIFFNFPVSVLMAVYTASAFGAFFGIFTRLSLFVFGFFSMYMIGFGASLGVFDHVNCLISQIIILMALIPGSTNLSFDRLIRYFLKYRKGEHFILYQAFFKAKDSVWGLRLMLILLAYVYFAAGFSKVRYGGLKWVDGNTLAFYLDGRANPAKLGRIPPMFLSSQEVKTQEKWKDGFGLYSYSYGNRQYSRLARKAGEFIASKPGLIMLFAIATVLFELSGFLILIDGWPRTVYLLGAILMHVSIGVLMNLDFISYRILDFLLIDWGWVVRQVPFLVHSKVLQLYNTLRGFFLMPIVRLGKELA
jgi:hypothetical protein